MMKKLLSNWLSYFKARTAAAFLQQQYRVRPFLQIVDIGFYIRRQ